MYFIGFQNFVLKICGVVLGWGSKSPHSAHFLLLLLAAVDRLEHNRTSETCFIGSNLTPPFFSAFNSLNLLPKSAHKAISLFIYRKPSIIYLFFYAPSVITGYGLHFHSLSLLSPAGNHLPSAQVTITAPFFVIET